MGDLNAGDRPLFAHKPGDAGQNLDVLVLPDAQVLGRDAAPRFDGGGFGHHQGGASYCAAA